MAYKSLSTANLPNPTIDPAQGSSPADYFNTVLYTGNNATQSIDVGFATDFTWIKVRNVADNHFLYDNVRGATKYLSSDTTSAEGTIANGLTSFTSTGFNLGDSGSTNNASNNFAAWNWKANGSGVSNTDGTITSTVSANTESGFSIVTYTGNQTNGATVGHGLSQTPEMIITKSRNQGVGWAVWHTGLSGITYWVSLNGTAGQSVDDMYTAVNSSTFALGADNWTNGNTYTFVSYCFHSVEGFSKFGSYTGNGNTDGTFVYTGFKPAFLLLKVTSVADDWIIWDGVRSPENLADNALKPNSSAAEVTGNINNSIDLVSNGFKCRNTNEKTNFSGYNYIYMAFAENPFKYSNAR